MINGSRIYFPIMNGKAYQGCLFPYTIQYDLLFESRCGTLAPAVINNDLSLYIDWEIGRYSPVHMNIDNV